MGGDVAVHVICGKWTIQNAKYVSSAFYNVLMLLYTPYLLLLQNYMYITNVQWNLDTASVTCIKQTLL